MAFCEKHGPSDLVVTLLTEQDFADCLLEFGLSQDDIPYSEITSVIIEGSEQNLALQYLRDAMWEKMESYIRAKINSATIRDVEVI